MSKNIIVDMENEVMFWTECDRKIANTIVNNLINMWDKADEESEEIEV